MVGWKQFIKIKIKFSLFYQMLTPSSQHLNKCNMVFANKYYVSSWLFYSIYLH